MDEHTNKLVLASGSQIRQRLLKDAGFSIIIDPANIDERKIEADIHDPKVLASRLAEEKASCVSARRPGALVLGSDQVFTLDGQFAHKPKNHEDLLAKLLSLSGRTHSFHCGYAFVRDGVTLHVGVDQVQVTFYDLSTDEIEDYAATLEGIGCAGGYRFEEGGVRLIREVAGSHFTVLGLPMLAVVAWLRESGELEGILTKKTGESGV